MAALGRTFQRAKENSMSFLSVLIVFSIWLAYEYVVFAKNRPIREEAGRVAEAEFQSLLQQDEWDLRRYHREDEEFYLDFYESHNRYYLPG